MSEKAPELTPEQEEIERQRWQVKNNAGREADADNSFIDNVVHDGKDPLPGEDRQYESPESIMHKDALEDEAERNQS